MNYAHHNKQTVTLLVSGDIIAQRSYRYIGQLNEIKSNWNKQYRLHDRPDGAGYSLRVLRDGSEQGVRLQLSTYRLPQPWIKLQVIISALIVASSLIVVGLIIGAFRPEDRAARLAFGTMVLFGSMSCSFP